MKKKSVWLTGLILIFVFFFAMAIPTKTRQKNNLQVQKKSVSGISSADTLNPGKKLYLALGLAAKGLQWETFSKAWNGFARLTEEGLIKNPLLSIVDMSQPSFKKRLYIIDMVANKLVINTLVAHGRNSGETMASNFSNKPESLQSSLGFYLTGETYEGNNGYSMRLKGLEKGFNDQAESRAIVMHGAPYVNESFAQKMGRIGRSWGCPAVSLAEHQQIINLIKNGSCLFVFAPQKQYLAHSVLAAGIATTSL
jgi:hypothetical protein